MEAGVRVEALSRRGLNASNIKASALSGKINIPLWSTLAVAAYTGLAFGAFTDMATLYYVVYYMALFLAMDAVFMMYGRVELLDAEEIKVPLITICLSAICFIVMRSYIRSTSNIGIGEDGSDRYCS